MPCKFQWLPIRRAKFLHGVGTPASFPSLASLGHLACVPCRIHANETCTPIAVRTHTPNYSVRLVGKMRTSENWESEQGTLRNRRWLQQAQTSTCDQESETCLFVQTEFCKWNCQTQVLDCFSASFWCHVNKSV